MGVLNPIRDLSDPPKRSFRTVLMGFLLGLGVGGFGGFFLGRTLPAEEPPAAAAVAAAEPAIAADGGSMDGEGPGEAADAGAEAAKDPLADRAIRLDIEIHGSLTASLATRMGSREADTLAAQVSRILVWWFDLRRDLLPGDRLQLLYEPVAGPGEFRVLALLFSSESRGITRRAYYFKSKDSAYGRYFDEQGQEIEKRLENSPIQEYEQITELMDASGRRHRGVDFKADVGTPIQAPFRAVVVRTNWQTRGNGNCLELRYLSSGVSALFLHLDEVLPEIRPGKVVEAGTPVARSGNTGRSTAPHLHYELHGPTGRLLNPFEFHPTVRRALEGDEREEFLRLRQRLDQSLSAGVN